MALTEPAETGAAGGEGKAPVQISDRDIVFDCDKCGGELVVDLDGEGLEVPCSHCGHLLTIPAYPGRPRSPEPVAAERKFDFSAYSPAQLAQRLEELRHQLTENRSQTTETRGNVNRATLEVHRLQLRLQKLTERQIEIEAEINAAQRPLA